MTHPLIGLLIKPFFVFHPILKKLGEVVVHMGNYNFTEFYQNWMKDKKVLLIAHLMDVLSVMVPLRSS